MTTGLIGLAAMEHLALVDERFCRQHWELRPFVAPKFKESRFKIYKNGSRLARAQRSSPADRADVTCHYFMHMTNLLLSAIYTKSSSRTTSEQWGLEPFGLIRTRHGLEGLVGIKCIGHEVR